MEIDIHPSVRFLSDEQRRQIIARARELLCSLGVQIHHDDLLDLLADAGAQVDRKKKRACLTQRLLDSALKSAPHSFRLFGTDGAETNYFSGRRVHFTPGSSAIHFLDPSGNTRRPVTADYIRYARLTSGLDNIAAQSTAFIPSDVTDQISDSYRLFLSLIYGTKAVVTGTFQENSFALMRRMLEAVRGSGPALKDKPLAVFTCCPTSPLKWTRLAARTLMDCARSAIPAEIVSMPLAGFSAPVTLQGMLVQHTAETLSGIVISQIVNPGTPVLFGGSPAVYDLRQGTTPMGAIESMMIACACNEIGTALGLPTQAYIALSDSKQLDAQAGLESGMGALLAVLSGINNISGPGMLDFENCFSLEKLVLDNELCGMSLRLARGIETRNDQPVLSLMQELLAEKQLLSSAHTLTWLRAEHYFPGQVIDRMSYGNWREKGSRNLIERARAEIEHMLRENRQAPLAEDIERELVAMMQSEARSRGQERLPARE